MIVFPNAKINLGLHVVRKRDDGFHDIETVFFPLGLKDMLEIIPSGDGQLSFTLSGIPIPGDAASNLCMKAWRMIADDFPIPPVKIHLHKIIPAGSGLGGGSSDGAFTLLALNDLFVLGLSRERLEEYARRMGSDCAFFIRNEPLLASGKGDRFEPVSVGLENYRIVIRTPGIHVGTAEAYSMVTPGPPRFPLKEIFSRPVTEWKNILVNDFEKPVMDRHPGIREAKEQLYREGAVYASMTGSGSAVYGIFAPDQL